MLRQTFKPREVVEALSDRLRSVCDELATVELDHRELIDAIASRGLCGDHGRVIPSRQRLCPECGGYVEIIDHVRLEAMKRFARYLARC